MVSPLFFVQMFLVHAVIGITAVVLSIVAAVAGNRGEWYRCPISVRFVRGAAHGREPGRSAYGRGVSRSALG